MIYKSCSPLLNPLFVNTLRALSRSGFPDIIPALEFVLPSEFGCPITDSFIE